MTVPAVRHRADGRGCVSRSVAGRRRTVNIGRGNAGRLVDLEVVHGVITATDPDTGEVLVDQTLDAARDYQRRRPVLDVNDAPRHA